MKDIWTYLLQTGHISLAEYIKLVSGSDYDIDKRYSLFVEKDGVFTQSIQLPGVSKEQVGVKVKENTFIVTIKEDTLYYKKDTSHIYYLPKYGKFKELKAVMKDGVLTITIPKKVSEFEVKVD